MFMFYTNVKNREGLPTLFPVQHRGSVTATPNGMSALLPTDKSDAFSENSVTECDSVCDASYTEDENVVSMPHCHQVNFKSPRLPRIRGKLSYAARRCAIDDCENASSGLRRKLCTYHQNRIYRIQRQYKTVTCTVAVDGSPCHNMAFRHGLCQRHFKMRNIGTFESLLTSTHT